MKKLACITLAIAISGCASSSKNIAASYVSPLQYHSYGCDQLAQESSRVHSRASSLAGRLDEAASNDQALVGVGMLLFWPALFALGGTKEQETEFSRLKGEYDAIQQVAIHKSCNLPAGPIAPPLQTAGGTIEVSPESSMRVMNDPYHQ